MIDYQYVIIGAGFAGAATAYYMACRGVKGILLLEQEAIPGFHSSGRNAAMIRQCVSDPVLAQMARDGAAFLCNLPPNWPVPVQFKQNGSLLLGSGEGWEQLKRDAELGRGLGVDVELWAPSKAKGHVPALKDAEFDGAVWCPTDGVVDIHALLSGYLKGATAKGAQVRYGGSVRGLRFRNDETAELFVNHEVVRARVIINAGGAWANTIAQMAGAARLPLRPCRRHLFASPPLAWIDPTWPFVWDVTHDIYFRPEGEGLLLCACDQDELKPGDPPVDPSVQELLAEKIQRFIPGLSSVSVSKSWAGFRTLTADGRFVIGWDPKVKGFFWVAGLGGHGVTTSSAVGSLAADLILDGDAGRAAAVSPRRLLA